MSKIILKGRSLSFKRTPHGLQDEASFCYHHNAAIAIADGIILYSGDIAGLPEAYKDWPVKDHHPHLLMPGFIDPHIHFPQIQAIASYAPDLLTWLNRYTFIEEQKFSDLTHCQTMAKYFFDELLRNGTTTAVAFCSVHKPSATAFFAEALKRNLRMIGGKVMMDRHAPPALTDNPQSGYDDSKSLIETWHGRGRLAYAITPRFAITSTPEQMAMSRALKQEHPDCYIQTHLSENVDEITFAKELYPRAIDYTNIYEAYDLLGAKSLFGHAIHLSPREINVLSESKSVAVHCPTSNLFLGSGLFDFFGIQDNPTPVRVAVATDIGGGTSYSLLKTLDEAYKIQQLKRQRLDPLRSFHAITLGNAEALSLEHAIGRLDTDYEADIVVLNASATPAMALRMATTESLAEELFVLQTLGDDRAIEATYVAGVNLKPKAIT